MKIALVCDWLTNVGGAERVLLSLHQLYPSAPIYTSQYNKKGIDWFKDADVRTGWLQIFPSSFRRFLGPLRQRYFSHLDLSDYDVVISVTGAEAKAVKHPRHLCYCHVPTQYYWQMFDEYIENPGFGLLNPLVRAVVKLFIKPLRHADFQAAQQPLEFITISQYAKTLIKKYYKRESRIIHPPVDVEKLVENSQSQHNVVKNTNYFITTARQVTWKRLDLAVEACLGTSEELIVIGSGPEHRRLQKLAGDFGYITFLPQMTQRELIPYLKNAKAYLFPSLEPFGIAPLEAITLGCPVIAFKQGGSLDYIKEDKNGLFFDKQDVLSLSRAILQFNKKHFDPQTVAATALPFSDARFKREIKELVKNVKI